LGKTLTKLLKDNTATAQQPLKKTSKLGTLIRVRLKLGITFKIATLNIRGLMRLGAREEIVTWMKENDIMILALQETRINTNSKEARGSYTWYLSGEGGKTKNQTYTAGVGFVIDNKYIKYIEDVIPHTERFIQLKLKGTCNINLINVYMPPAVSKIIVTEEEKEIIYKKLDAITYKARGKGPTYILGDWNARMQAQQSKEESKVFGKWTLEPDKCKVHELSDAVKWNRRRCIQFCQKHKLFLANTNFKKIPGKTATFRGKTDIDQEITHKNHEQIDYIAVQHRWKNSILNAESDSTSNIKSDHYPVTATIRIKLRAIKRGRGPGRNKYQESTKEQKQERNDNMLSKIQALTTSPQGDLQAKTNNFITILTEGTEELPIIPKKEKEEAFSNQTRQLLQQRKTPY
jgi:exonuclease III